MNTIGDRIKTKRKELGLTQVELGEKLHVTDRAVSKWEQNDGNPDFSLLPQLAEILGVTLDYLITGKVVEPLINLDDMDATKRAGYLAERDDIDNFTKYGYVSIANLCNDVQHGRLNESPIKKAIYKHQSVKIFSALMDEFLKIRPMQWYGLHTVMPYIYDDIDDFVKLCALSNRTDVLDFIGFYTFSVVREKPQKTDRRMLTWSINEYEARNSRFKITKDTFEFPFTDERVAEETLAYFATMHFAPINYSGTIYQCEMNDAIIGLLYRTKRFNMLTKALEAMQTNVAYYIQNKDEARRQQIIVEPICTALNEAKQSLDIKWIRIFNDYNKEIAKAVGSSFLSEEDIAALEVKAKPDATEDEIIVADNIRLGLLNYRVLKESRRDIVELKKNHSDNKHLYKTIITQNYIHYMELIESLLAKKDYKKLFEFACDYELKTLEDPILSVDDNAILSAARTLFVPADSFMKRLTMFCENIKNCKEKQQQYTREHTPPRYGSWYDDSNYRDFSTRIDHSNKELKIVASNWLESIKDNDKLLAMLKRQLQVFPIEFYYSVGDSYSQRCKQIKEAYYTECQERIEQAIEKITHDKALQEEYDSTINTITEQYLSELLQSGNTELFIIKLCVRMDTILKYKRYEGEDFFSRMDAFFKKNVPASRDCDDGWGYMVLDTAFEEKEVKPWQRRRELFNRLRMQRNNIAHSDNNNVEPLTQDELQECMKFVLSM